MPSQATLWTIVIVAIVLSLMLTGLMKLFGIEPNVAVVAVITSVVCGVTVAVREGRPAKTQRAD